MSVQNSLIKPSFNKSVMGYNTGEVDKYVEHVSERYNSVCRENAELKRRLIAESVRIREAEEKIAELEKNAVAGVKLDKGELNKIFDVLNAEKERFAYFVESLKESLNAICSEGEDLFTADDSWEDALGGYIEEVCHTNDEPSDTDLSAEKSDDSVGFYEIDEDTDAYDEETDNVLSIFDSGVKTVETEEDSETDVTASAYTVFDDSNDCDTADESNSGSDADIPADDTSSDESNEPDEPVDTRTPAQIAADLDFYTDGDHADGESFDPMTLAAQITARNSRPKLEDFMKTIPSDDN